MKNKVVIITGGTDGIGAATAIELCKAGAVVHIIGRSESKAKALKERTYEFASQLTCSISDFSLLSNVENTAIEISEMFEKVDYVIHAVGILITNIQHTSEGLEKDFAVSYLSRFLFNEILYAKGKFHARTKILNIAASSPKVPAFAQMEFNDLSEVRSRVGIKSHGQAQLANDLYTALASKRYSIVSIGYGPGSVDTNIRREVPKFFRIIMKPLFYFTTRRPEDVAKQLIEILTEVNHTSGNSYYYNKRGRFGIASFIDNDRRQEDLLKTTLSLINLGKPAL